MYGRQCCHAGWLLCPERNADTVIGPVQISDILAPVHMFRVVQVRAIPPDMQYYGRGPLLIAKFRDASLLWRRAEQIAEVLDEVNRPPSDTVFPGAASVGTIQYVTFLECRQPCPFVNGPLLIGRCFMHGLCVRVLLA